MRKCLIAQRTIPDPDGSKGVASGTKYGMLATKYRDQCNGQASRQQGKFDDRINNRKWLMIISFGLDRGRAGSFL